MVKRRFQVLYGEGFAFSVIVITVSFIARNFEIINHDYELMPILRDQFDLFFQG